MMFVIYYLDKVVRAEEMMIYDMHDIHARSHAEEITGLVQTTRIFRKFVGMDVPEESYEILHVAAWL